MSGLTNMKQRMRVYGQTTDERIVDAKRRSMLAASELSYQGEDITFNGQKCRCLINPSKLTEDFDQKIISIDYKYGLGPGDVFLWDRTNTYWIGVLKQWTEEAYLRMEIRKCNYCITINDYSNYWVYVQGPTVSTIDWTQEHKLNINDLNYDLVMYITKNDETLDYFNRFTQVKINGNNYEVQSTDKMSLDAIIQIYLKEDHNTPTEDAAAEYEKQKEKERQEQKRKEQEEKDRKAAEQSEERVITKIYISGSEEVYCYDTDLEYKINGIEFKTSSTYMWKTSSDKAVITKQTDKNCYIDIKFRHGSTFKLSLLEDNIEVAALEITVKQI